ncbi:EAP30/Vps36 family-domain-containing protein [Gilbertella persicaria]|uniref:EAP30/Vps36 family-domain-containing protein n=1 Tax=Gilbertella persicaria TaxID=101096 RepID=UPI00221F6081|nr:EAP30/Vps36 family-domain-containing protein [Gilbertella persicaria]KAI8084213.1 EAP30/Vps36 family-domain-containing protein [Gilbertella persicaria]
MRRRAVGMAQADLRKRTEQDYKQIGSSIAAKELEQLQKQMEVFKTNLQEFATRHRKDIRKDPTFRAHFQRMCANIGVDPLASNKGFWADLLGVGDFYYELGIQIIEACIVSRTNDGGLTELNEIMRRVQVMRQQQQQVSEDDITRAIKTLKPLSGGYEVIQIGNRKLVRSVPKELDKDQASLLLLAQKTGYINHDMVKNELGWTTERINTATQHLLQDSIAWLDRYGDVDSYWIPSYFSASNKE